MCMIKKHEFNVIRVDPSGGNKFTENYDFYAWIQAGDYETIFGIKRRLKRRGKKKYIRIEESKSKNKIYRTIETAGQGGLKKSSVGLSYNSISDLGLKPNNLTDARVTIKPIHPFTFMLNNPDEVQKYTVWLSLATFALGLIIGQILQYCVQWISKFWL